MRDWEEPRRRFVTEGASLSRIALECGIPYSTIVQRAKREDWRGQREKLTQEENGARLERLTKRLFDQIETALYASEGMEAKDFKAVIGALRELNELCGEKAGGALGGELTVRFVGEAEEYSK